MDLSDLRQAAIDLLGKRAGESGELWRQSPEKLIHELRVHQAELEMQNEELRRAQLELEESRDRFANLFDFAPVGYVTLDPSDRIVEVNLTMARLLGMERQDIVRQVLSQYVASEDSTRLWHHLRDINTAGKKTSCELRLQTADGRLLPVRLDSIDLGNGSRSVAIADLSENADLVLAAQDSDERLRVVCQALPIPVAYIDGTGTYQFSNAAHEEWFGISCESIPGRHASEVFGHMIYEIMEPKIELVLTGRAHSFRVEFPNGDDGRRVVEKHTMHLIAIAKTMSSDSMMMMFDVSARRDVEEEEARQAQLKG